MEDDDEFEYTILNKREVQVFQIPPAASASGHKAGDWEKCIWRGRMVIQGKSKDLSIKLLEAGGEKLFAQCAIPGGEHEKYVERVTDSSRYFVLKITNGARHAFIGMGFEDRNDAFDFNCALSDFKGDRSDTSDTQINTGPAKDLSLKEGQKITLKLKGVVSKPDGDGNSGTKATTSLGAGSAGGGFGLLAPPPPSSGVRRSDAQVGGFPLPPPSSGGVAATAGFPQAAPASVASGGYTAAQAPALGAFGGSGADDFGDFGDFCGFQSASVAPAAPAPAVAAAQPAGRTADLASQMQGLDLGGGCGSGGVGGPGGSGGFGGFGAAVPAPKAQASPMANFGDLTNLSGPAVQAKPPSAAPAKSGFDEFDIFK